MATKKKTIDPKTKVGTLLYNRTLRTVNSLLTLGGKTPLTKLPHGIPKTTDSCPIARALRPLGKIDVVERLSGTMKFSSLYLDLDDEEIFVQKTFRTTVGNLDYSILSGTKVDVNDFPKLAIALNKMNNVVPDFTEAFDEGEAEYE